MHQFKITFLLFAVVALAACGQKKKPADNQTPAAAVVATADSSSQKTIVFFGNSLTAGYGLDDPSNSFPGVIKNKIDSLKLPYKVVNAGLSGETTAGGNGRIGWLLKQKIDVFLLELGANDGLRGIPVDGTSKNLQSIIDKVKAKYPDAKIVLLGMMVPPNMGADYSNKFKAVFPALASKNKVSLVPFLLKDVAGVPALNQADGIHPSVQGAKIAAQNVWVVLKDLL
ncbi:arylesterase [Mucilaginibacter sp. SP1R1]|uniref:arylesterase n=1 Tax=Mucilaginibacter sp. SP1R1 TaxID=2723091 RepID=UPI001615BF19|nr:arylesterase [Mucilaginibacter sp. SP1R1]MBB6152580.1 acyl-CoA thioesterase-1 [Mucilaginibacter sp. SP1R1]